VTPDGDDRPEGATPLNGSSELASLVAGNVTGGGGKATKKRPSGTGRANANRSNLFELGADRRRSSAGQDSGYKKTGGSLRVHVRTAKPFS